MENMAMNLMVMESCMYNTRSEEMETDEDGCLIDEVLPEDLHTSSHSSLDPQDCGSTQPEEGSNGGFNLNEVPLPEMVLGGAYLKSSGGIDLCFFNEDDYSLLPKVQNVSAYVKDFECKLSRANLHNPSVFSHSKASYASTACTEECQRLQEVAAWKTAKRIEEQQAEIEMIKIEKAEIVELKRELKEKKKIVAEAESSAQKDLGKAKAVVAVWNKELAKVEEKLKKAETSKRKAVKNYKTAQSMIASTKKSRDRLYQWLENHGIKVIVVDDDVVGPTGSALPTATSEESAVFLQLTDINSEDPNQVFGVEFLRLKVPECDFAVKTVIPSFDEAFALVQEVNKTQDFIKFIVECKRYWIQLLGSTKCDGLNSTRSSGITSSISSSSTENRIGSTSSSCGGIVPSSGTGSRSGSASSNCSEKPLISKIPNSAHLSSNLCQPSSSSSTVRFALPAEAEEQVLEDSAVEM